MYKITFITCITLFFMSWVNGQSIRKNYREMTQSEKDELVDAFFQLGPGSGPGNLIEDIANFHSANFFSIHYNLPSTPANDVFLAWHRSQIFEVEQAMQNINPNISIPFWDWTIDRSTLSPLWDNDFMGQFNALWSLGRSFNTWSNPHLPEASHITSLQAIPASNWLTYTNNLERGLIHSGGHVWIGGIMNSGNSPLDPVFYLHHGMIDKLWQDWVENNGVTPSSNLYMATSLPRYTTVNPDNIVDSRALGVFYAENELAELDDYTVSNTYNSQETFYYQYRIEAGDDFIVPSGKDARIESVNEVILKAGFHAESGSDFIAKIDIDDDINTAEKWDNPIARQQVQHDYNEALENAYSIQSLSEEISVNLFPNPTKDVINIQISSDFSNAKLEMYDIQGRIVLSRELSSMKEKVNIEHLDSGFYMMKIYLNGKALEAKKIVKN